MEREEPDFDKEDSGVPVTSPDRNPDPLGPQHSVPEGADGGGDAGGGGGPAAHVRDQRAGAPAEDPDAEPVPSTEGGPAVPDRDSGMTKSNPAEGL